MSLSNLRTTKEGEYAKAVLSNMEPASDPMDFIKKNLARAQERRLGQTSQPQEPPIQETVPTVAPEINFSVEQPEVETPPPVEVQTVEEEPIEETALEETDEEASTGNELLDGVKKKGVSSKENIKILRKSLNETRAQAEARENKIKELEEEVQKFKTGEALPDKIREYQEKIGELSHFERLHALKTSKEYKEKWVVPLDKLKEEAVQLATDYQVDPTIFNNAMKLDNRRDLNVFLRKYFDEVGALEAKELIAKIKETYDGAEKAKAEPAKELERLEAETAAREEQAVRARYETISTNAQGAWVTSLKEVREKGEYPELLLKDGDEEHNKISKAVLDEAGSAYGKLTKALAQLGVKELPPEIAKDLSKRYLISQAASVMSVSRAQHFARAEELATKVKSQNSFRRPPIGVSSPGAEIGGSVKTVPSMQQAAQMALGKAMRR